MVENFVLILSWLLCNGVLPCSGQTNNIRLDPTLLQGRCPGEVVTLTCTTMGSTIIAWRSAEYIGPGLTQLEFATADFAGAIERSDQYPNTVYATLIEKDTDRLLLTSTLNITLSDTFQRSTVTCVNIVTSDIIDATISLLDDAEELRRVQSDLRREPNNSCAVDLLWDLPSNFEEEHVSHFTVTINDTDNSTTNETSTMTSHNYAMCVCEPHNVTITLVDRCGRNSSTTSVITSNRSRPMFDCGRETNAPASLLNDPSTLGFFVAFLVFLVIAVVSVSINILGCILLMCCMKKVRKNSVHTRDQPTLKQKSEVSTKNEDVPTFPHGEKDGTTKKSINILGCIPCCNFGYEHLKTNEQPAAEITATTISNPPHESQDGASKEDDPPASPPTGENKSDGTTIRKNNDSPSPPGKQGNAIKKDTPTSQSEKKDGATKKVDPTPPPGKLGGVTKKVDPTITPPPGKLGGATKKVDPTPQPGSLKDKLKKFESLPSEQEHNKKKSSDPARTEEEPIESTYINY